MRLSQPFDFLLSLTAELGKLAGDELGRAMLLEAKLGVRVQVLPPGGHFAVKCFDAIGNLHFRSLLLCVGIRGG
jgi:hypothetical protein